MEAATLPLSPDKIADSLREILFADRDLNVFAVLEGASIPDLLEKLDECQPEYACRYRRELDDVLECAAPYLVRLEENSPFTDWILREGWGKHWGVFATADADLKVLRQHFRTFLMVKAPEGKTLYFRYYDPRVLTIFLPTTTVVERQTVFGITSAYFAESTEGDFLASRCDDVIESRREQ